MVKQKTNQKTKQIRYAATGRVYVTATFNNTIVTVTDETGKALVWGSCGASGFSGTRKSTPFAATSAIEKTLDTAMQTYGLKTAAIYIRGIGPGRDSLLRVLRNSNLDVSKIVDRTPVPHDGIRPRKKRRA